MIVDLSKYVLNEGENIAVIFQRALLNHETPKRNTETPKQPVFLIMLFLRYRTSFFMSRVFFMRRCWLRLYVILRNRSNDSGTENLEPEGCTS